MKASNLDLYEALLKQSLLVPGLVTKSARKAGSFLNDLDQWLQETEAVMQKNRLPQCSEIAGLRSKIIHASSAPASQVAPRRKHQFSVATSVIYDAQSTVMKVLEPIEKRLGEAREAVRQLLGVAYQADMIDRDMEFNRLVQTLWSTFSTHEQLKGITSRILVFVDRSDALRLLAEEIDLSQ